MKKRSIRKGMSLKTVVLVILIIIVAIFGAVATFMLLFTLREPAISDAVRFSIEYPLVPEDNVFIYKSATEVADILESGTGAVFLSTRACLWCQAYAALLHQAAMNAGIEAIYYTDTRLERENNTVAYRRIIRVLGDYLRADTDGRPRVFLPDFSVVKDGVVIGHDNETSDIDGMDPSEYWTNRRAHALMQRLEAMMREIL